MRWCTQLLPAACMVSVIACGQPADKQPSPDLNPPVHHAPTTAGAAGLAWTVQATAPPAQIFSYAPPWLSDTGLYENLATGQLAPGVMPFQPQYSLWADSATKQRWVYLPAGAQIDSSNMDRWVYPIGTKLWKEFQVNGQRIETRMQWKRAEPTADDAGWEMVTYAWLPDDSDAALNLLGQTDAQGSGHDIPPQMDCKECHRPTNERPLGFSAIQLSGTATGANMQYLTTNNWLTVPPPSPAGYVIPGTGALHDGLGYLHANCGGCHAYDSDLYMEVNMALRMTVSMLGSVQATPMFLTAVNQLTMSTKGGTQGEIRIKPGDPMDSAIYIRMDTREVNSESIQMPPLGTNEVDTTGLGTIASMIEALP